jgi:hypothetical protein
MASTFPTSLDNFTNPTVSDYLNSTTVPHATQHADLNDAVEALEAKVGVDGSAVTSSHDYILTNGVLPTLNVDSGVLVVDDTNNRVGVNDATPSYALDVTGDINATGAFRVNGTPQGTWVDFSGSLTLTNWTLGNGTIIICRYAQIGKVVHYVGDIILGSTSTTVGDVRVNLPVTAARGYAQQSGLAKYFDIGTALHAGMCMFENQTTLNMMVLDANTTKVHLQNVGTTNPFTWSGAAGDRFIWQITYQAA